MPVAVNDYSAISCPKCRRRCLICRSVTAHSNVIAAASQPRSPLRNPCPTSPLPNHPCHSCYHIFLPRYSLGSDCNCHRCLHPQQLQSQPKPSSTTAAALSFNLLCFLLPLLAVVAFLLNRSLTCHVVASLSPTTALTAVNYLCPPLADVDNLVAVKSYYIYDICP
ncbi:hypothetical protein BHE74_00035382 [Ensete ventricosum]|nr:hypothetical protein GW17_00060294 [Ensete ventricosum]RWW57814.1 hypothetical protein BHE74_00035382 [Ensete ventricosum]